MSLTNPTIPIELPIDIPVLLHPVIVHFAVAIPIIVILLEFINLFFRKRALSVFSLFLLIVTALIMAGAYFTGSTDGKEALSALSAMGKDALNQHKLLGIYIVYGSLVLIVIKLLFMFFSSIIARLFFLFILTGFSVVILKQGYDGGQLLYKYGANIQQQSSKTTTDSNKDDLKDELEKLQAKYNELKESIAESKKEAVEETKEETKKEESVTEETKEDNSQETTSEEDNSTTEESNTTN